MTMKEIRKKSNEIKKKRIDAVIAKVKETDTTSTTEELISDTIDGNYYGELDKVKVCKCKVEIESIWTDADGHINLHIADEEFEGDVQLFSLPDKEIIKVLKSVKKALDSNEYNNA